MAENDKYLKICEKTMGQDGLWAINLDNCLNNKKKWQSDEIFPGSYLF
jgi:hypothetical protein